MTRKILTNSDVALFLNETLLRASVTQILWDRNQEMGLVCPYCDSILVGITCRQCGAGAGKSTFVPRTQAIIECAFQDVSPLVEMQAGSTLEVLGFYCSTREYHAESVVMRLRQCSIDGVEMIEPVLWWHPENIEVLTIRLLISCMLEIVKQDG